MKNPITGNILQSAQALKEAFFAPSYHNIRFTLETFVAFKAELEAYAEEYDFFCPCENTVLKWWRLHRLELAQHYLDNE